MARLTPYLILILLFLAVPAKAQEINDLGAKKLKALFSGLVKNQKMAIERVGGTLEMDGPITVEQGDSYYAVTLPAMVFKTVEGELTKIGLIAVNVTPTDKTEEWKMSMAIPSPVLIEDTKSKKVTRLDIGDQTMSGVWHEKLENFSKFSARYNDLTLSQNLRQETLTIKQLDVAVDLKETGIGYWSGPTKFGITGLSFGKPDAPRSVYADTIKFGITVKDFSPTAQKEALTQISEAADAMQDGDKGDEEDISSNLLLDLIKNSGKSIGLQGAIKGLEVNVPSLPDLTQRRFALESGSFIFDMSADDEGLLNQTFKIAYRGLEAPKSDKVMHDILPTIFQTHIALKNIPLEKLFDAGAGLLPSADKKSKQIAALSAMITVPQILSRANTSMTINETKYENETYKTTIKGSLNASKKSIIGLVGDMTLKMTGLENLIQKLENKRDTATPLERAKLEKTLKRLNFISKISIKEEDEHICNIKLGEKANITVNGAGLSKLYKAEPEKTPEPSKQVTE